MTKEQEALKLALEALEAVAIEGDVACVVKPDGTIYLRPVITAIKEFLAQPEERNFCPRCGKRNADLTTIHTCTPPVAADNEAFYGFPQGSVSTSNAGGKCVTAGETAPVKEIDPNQWAFDRGLEST